jgi:hypothetical protein
LSMVHLLQELTDVPAADDLHHRLQLERHANGAPRQGNYCLLTLFIRIQLQKFTQGMLWHKPA